MTVSKYPVGIDISEVWLTNYAQDFMINLMPQFVGLDLYLSIFSPTIKAEMFLLDPIGLIVNFPIVGEEFVTVKLSKPINSGIRELYFRLTRVKDIVPNRDGRSSTYTLELHSFEYVQNMKNRIYTAFNEPISNMVEKIVRNDLKSLKTFEAETTKGNQYVVIPNMYPLEAIKFLTKRAVANDTGHRNYVFYESLDGFEFKTLQQLVSLTGAGDDERPTYYYLSQIADHNRHLEPYSIMQLNINKRYDTSEKLSTGFYENEYFEIDPLNKQWNITRTKVSDKPDKTIAPGQLNTSDFIKEMQAKEEKDENTARTRYTVWSQDPTVSEPFFRDKFGEGAQLMTAFSQVSLTILVQGNADLDIGDVITIRIPEFHGFNLSDADKYIQGNYLIADLKHQVMLDGKFTTLMNIHKDSYSTPIEGTEYDKLKFGIVPATKFVLS